jgi:hypothetical protein
VTCLHPARQVSAKARLGATGAFVAFHFVFQLLVPLSLEAESVAAILSSGSTNVAGYRIDLERSGSATYTPIANRLNPEASAELEPRRHLIPHSLVQRFYADLQKAQPLASLPRQRCMKSASFGLTLVIQLGDQETPDLACGDGGNATLRTLIRDVNEIVRLVSSK